ncbi:outer membrane beta-barrel protein [Formosa sp. 3Alg 14/1]|uniref:outer membrane beta-barrel protein n=1 Tax=Formosa sp. 3Alg 14/1 TaxID=3382190 RepID=UPI0039BDE3F8
MSSKIKKQKYISTVVILLFFFSFQGMSQIDEDVLRLKFAVGGNHVSNTGFAEGYGAKEFNLPSVTLGAQYMFTEKLGAKLDLGFSRIKGENDEFKINYTRINGQAVYDYTHLFNFDKKSNFQFQAHGGPGFTLVRPLEGLREVDQSYFNFILGVETLYALSRTTGVFFDVSYIHGFTKPDTYTPAINGLGAFNGSMFTFTIGVSLSLSGCYYCN